MPIFANGSELIAAFGNLEGTGFFDPIILGDVKVGFSIKREYPTDIRYKPAIGQESGKPDNIAALWVVYTHPDESRKAASESAVPIRIRIATISRYRSRHWDYNYDDKDGDSPSRDSVEASAATPKPLELEYFGDYFFDHTNETFTDRKGVPLAGAAILDRVFKDHCKTVHLFWGLRLRLKLFAQGKVAGLLGGVTALLAWALKNLFGRSLEDKDMMAGTFRPYKAEALKKYDMDSLDVLGYKASKQVVVLFCLLVILASMSRYLGSPPTPGYWETIGNSEFLSLIHGLFFIWLLDVVVPWMLFWTINAVISLRTAILFRKIKGP